MTIQTEITSHLQDAEKVKEAQGAEVPSGMMLSVIFRENFLSLLFHLPSITGPRDDRASQNPGSSLLLPPALRTGGREKPH